MLQPAMRPDQILDMLLGQRSQPEPSSTRAAKSSTPSTPPQQSPPPKQEEAQDASLVLPDAVLALQQPRSNEPRVPRQVAGSGISTVAAESDVMAMPVARESQQQAGRLTFTAQHHTTFSATRPEPCWLGGLHVSVSVSTGRHPQPSRQPS